METSPPISSFAIITRRKHSELKHSFFSDTAHHLGTFKAVPVGSLEWAGKSPSKMGALPLPWADWHQLPYTALCWARERKGGDHGNEKTLISALWCLSKEALLNDHVWWTVRQTSQRRDQDGLTCTHQASPDETPPLQESDNQTCLLLWYTGQNTASIRCSCQKSLTKMESVL